MLKSLQEQFITYLSDDNSKLDWISSENSQERLGIYKNTILKNLTQALALTYPGVWALLGEECAQAVAHRYLKDPDHFPRDGCLEDWGFSFVPFLKTVTELQSLPYISDYARYEWLKHWSDCSPNQPCLNKYSIQQRLNSIDDPHLLFHPSVQWLQSDFALDEIEAVIDDPLSKSIQLSQKPAFAMITRTQGIITTYWLNEAQWALCHDLYQQLCLTTACENAEKNLSSTECAQTLSLLFNADAIIDII